MKQVLVFVRMKRDANKLARELERDGINATAIHSDRSQAEREQALADFKEGRATCLVATDIAARGIDIPKIRHIINFDMPDTVEDYIHRAGRTARGRNEGIVSTIASWMDKAMIKEIESTLGEDLPRCTVPGVQPYVEMKPRTSMSSRKSALKVKRR